MGSFYTNITLRTSQQASVVSALRSAGRTALVSRSVNNCTMVYDRETEDQDLDTLRDLADSLSETLRCPALAVMNHDDDVLIISLHEDGGLVDEYNSSPGYFDTGPGEAPEGGDAKRLCKAFGATDVDAVEAALRAENAAAGGPGFVFETERHEALVNALGLPVIAVSTGFNYLEEGEYPPDTTAESFTPT
jgi:hypothetical protein